MLYNKFDILVFGNDDYEISIDFKYVNKTNSNNFQFVGIEYFIKTENIYESDAVVLKSDVYCFEGFNECHTAFPKIKKIFNCRQAMGDCG